MSVLRSCFQMGLGQYKWNIINNECAALLCVLPSCVCSPVCALLCVCPVCASCVCPPVCALLCVPPVCCPPVCAALLSVLPSCVSISPYVVRATQSSPLL